MGSSASRSTTSSSKLVKATPLKKRTCIPDNDPVDHQQDHIPIDRELIDYVLKEVPQNACVKGTGREKAPDLRITYFPSGFTVGPVLCGDLAGISDPDEPVCLLDPTRPEGTVVYVEFCDPAYGRNSYARRRGRPTTRGEFAKFVAEEIQKIIADLPNFPYSLDEIKVLSIDARSRETVQPRIFVEYLPAWDAFPRNASRRA